MGVLHLNQEKEKMKQNAQRTTHVEQDIYHSRPTTIRAFQFTENNIKPPVWFVEACVKGEASVTINGKERHITIYNDGERYIARTYDWITCDEDGLLVVKNKRFERCFIAE